MKSLTLVLSTFFFSLILWIGTYNFLPEKVAMHFDGNNVNQYASKSFMFMMFMLITIILLLLLFIFLNIDNKNPNKLKINKPFSIIGIIFVLSLNIIYLMNVQNESLKTEFLIVLFIGFMLFVVGNYLPQIKYNSKYGVKNWATVQNPQNWNKVQRFSGNTFVIGGLLICIFSFSIPFLIALLLTFFVIGVMLFVIHMYSNRLAN
ncbi:SdpI family protein [Rummeliibacillus sp. NPDC094406]|uniref:SdpI family protein n=1 Tax=Rummeliibacillus sp. NPDC094406 TaxID=3364511 RepID=UPI00381773CC